MWPKQFETKFAPKKLAQSQQWILGNNSRCVRVWFFLWPPARRVNIAIAISMAVLIAMVDIKHLKCSKNTKLLKV